jgi:hypothetical protein
VARGLFFFDMQQSGFNFEKLEDEMISPLAGHALSELEGYIAGLLLRASSERPYRIADIIGWVGLNLHTTIDERTVKEVIRSLRREHKFPILARRGKPAGYWWCMSASEMEEFITLFRSQALDELHTLSQIVKHNYPGLIGQLRLDGTD